jgi:hypothetical protein
MHAFCHGRYRPQFGSFDVFGTVGAFDAFGENIRDVGMKIFQYFY